MQRRAGFNAGPFSICAISTIEAATLPCQKREPFVRHVPDYQAALCLLLRICGRGGGKSLLTADRKATQSSGVRP